jgi:hypothetical protein
MLLFQWRNQVGYLYSQEQTVPLVLPVSFFRRCLVFYLMHNECFQSFLSRGGVFLFIDCIMLLQVWFRLDQRSCEEQCWSWGNWALNEQSEDYSGLFFLSSSTFMFCCVCLMTQLNRGCVCLEVWHKSWAVPSLHFLSLFILA